VIVDETGNLNRARGLWASHDRIDLFVAGDSVLQGFGSPSVFELLRDQLPIMLWNLSMVAYGPREKISALMAHALPKRPQWLVVEFYAGNDVSDAIKSDLFEGSEDFRGRFSSELTHRLVRHPLYGHIIDQSGDLFELFAYYASQNLTLAMTRYFVDNLKGAIKQDASAGTWREVQTSQGESDAVYRPKTIFPSVPEEVSANQSKLLDWVTAGMALTHKNYERLVTRMATLEQKPTVILLYNPSPYELYRDILMDRDPAYDQFVDFELEAQRSFARQHGWRFLDLTVPLRQKLQQNRAWLYGRYDPFHWSPRGTAFVAPVLKAELLAMIAQ
jgi:hypothetical protein